MFVTVTSSFTEFSVYVCMRQVPTASGFFLLNVDPLPIWPAPPVLRRNGAHVLDVHRRTKLRTARCSACGRLAPGSGVGLLPVATLPLAGAHRRAPLATWNVAADASSAEKLASFEALQLSSDKAGHPPAEPIIKYGSAQSLLGTRTNGPPINYERRAWHNKSRAGQQEAGRRLRHDMSHQPQLPADLLLRVERQDGQGTIHACAAIPAGVELTISYYAPR